MNISLKDGSVLQVAPGENGQVTVADAAKQISMGLFRNAMCAKINGNLADLRDTLQDGDSLEICTFDSEEGKKAFWHTASHVMAQAVTHLFPDAKLSIGPAIDSGFYYDFMVEEPFTPEQLEQITEEMKKIVKADLPITRRLLPPEEAVALLESREEPFKVELCKEHADKGEEISFYAQGDFEDLCAGPHLMSTGGVKAIQLTATTGAYWRGDATKEQMCRVYGVAFPKASQLAEHLERLEEAKRRDHRKLGKELGLFAMLDEGPGFPFFLPNGMILKNGLIDYWRQIHRAAGYQEISTPMMLNRALWERSGHWGHYKNNMYTTVIDETDFAVKPMNCPGGMLVYKTQPRSYRDLPLRMGELGLVHRHELSGALHGLMRVRCFTQDDAHIFMTPDQIKQEIKGVVQLIDQVYDLFGFTYHIELSTMPEDHMGDEADWERATDGLRSAIEELGRAYTVNEGDGAFYGPKLDFHLVDAIGRTWQCGTIQLDMQLPERFELEYTGEDGQKHRPVMIHRVVFGSIERFMGILTEHFAGAFPLWLSPEQVRVLPISEKYQQQAEEITAKLVAAGLRASTDARNEKIGFRIREGQLMKVPYLLIVGEKEVESGTVSVRKRGGVDLGSMPTADLIAKLLQEVADKVRD